MSGVEARGAVLLLTGGAGFLGSRFVELYAKEFKAVYVLDNFTNSPRRLSEPNVHYVEMDLNDKAAYERLPGHVDACIHLAAAISVFESNENPEKYRRINVDGSRCVFEWCATHGCKACVCASTAAVYGRVAKEPLREEDADGGLSPYAQTKFEMERVARELFPSCRGVLTYAQDGDQQHGAAAEVVGNEMRVNFIRPFNIYGPRQACGAHASFIPSAITHAVSDGSVCVCGDGKQTRDFVYVDDVCHAFFMLLTAQPAHAQGEKGVQHLRPYNVGTGHSVAIVDLAQSIAKAATKALGREITVEHIAARPAESMFSEADISAIKRDVGWAPKMELEQGLEVAVDWFIHNCQKH